MNNSLSLPALSHSHASTPTQKLNIFEDEDISRNNSLENEFDFLRNHSTTNNSNSPKEHIPDFERSRLQSIANSTESHDKLITQFQFFRQECMEAALAAGVTVPLDILEDKSCRLSTFVEQRGPRYLLQIMHSNSDSVHLLRVSHFLHLINFTALP